MITKDETVYESEDDAEEPGENEMNELSDDAINPPPSPEMENTVNVNDTRG